MSLNAGTVYATLGGRFSRAGFDQFGRAMYGARSDMEATEKRAATMAARSQQSMEKMGHAAKVVAGGGILALGAAVAYSVKKAADFEQQLDALGSVSNATGRQMKLLRQQALDAGAATKYSALQAAQAQTELAKGGLTAKQILGGGLKAALALAAAGELDLGDAATYTVNAMKLFKLHGADSIHVADAMATAANSTTADVKDFGMALVQGGSAAKAAGLDFDQTMTILEALAEVGVKNSDAGTSMKTALLQLIGPTKKQAEAAKKAGLDFIDQHGAMKDVADISAMLRDKTQDLNNAQREALFKTLAGTDGFRALYALYDAGPAKLKRLQDGLDKEGTAAKVAAEKQDNLKGKVENLGGSIETAAIQIGSKLLPKLEQGATQATHFINAFVSSGQADQFATGVVHGMEEVVQVGGDVIHIGGQVAGVLLDIGRALDLGDPTHVEELLAAFAGFKVAGLVAPMVANLATSLGSLVANARTAPSVGAFLRDIPALANPIGLVSLAAAGLGAALVALGGRESDEARLAREDADAHKEQAEAIKSVSDAERAAADKGLAAKQAELDYKKAVENFNEVRKHAKKSSDDYKQALLDLQQASLRAHATQDDYNKSLADQNAANDKLVNGARTRLKAARDEVSTLQKQIQGEKDLARVGPGARAGGARFPGAADPEKVKALAAAMRDLSVRNEDYIQAVARSNVSETNRQRLMDRSTQITRANTLGVADLIRNLDGVPKQVQAKLLVQNQDALAKAGELSTLLVRIGQKDTVAKILTNAPSAQAAVAAFRAVLGGVPGSKAVQILQNARSAGAAVEAFKAILAGVPASKVVHILQNADSAAGAVSRLRDAINSLPSSRTVTLTTVERHLIENRTNNVVTNTGKVLPKGASGFHRGQAETALIGEAGREYRIDARTGLGYMTGGPQITALGPDDYVIPVERYRGRALGLFSMLARDLGIPGYQGGKHPKKKHSYRVPARISEGGVPFTDVQQTYEHARQEDQDAKRSERDARRAERDARHAVAQAQRTASHAKTAAERASARAELHKAQVARTRAQQHTAKAIAHAQAVAETLRKRTADFKAARTLDRHVKDLESDINVLRDRMQLADGRDDFSGFENARKARLSKLKELRGLLQTAHDVRGATHANVRDLNEQISQLDLDIQDTSTQTATPNQQAPSTLEDFMTAAELGRRDNLERDFTLAELTPDVADDQRTAGAIVGFTQGVLARLQAAHAPAAVITQAAQAVLDARGQLAGVNQGDTNADLAAQIDQANERARVAATNQAISDAALAAFGSSGDIGAGGRNAAAAVVQNIYTLHPGDARTLRAVGSAATAGIDLQASRRPQRVKVGV